MKNNLAPPRPSLACAVQPREDGTPQLSWLGPHPWTADQLLVGPNAHSPDRPVLRAREFLRAFLADGPRTPRDIWPAARDQGFTRRTLRRAKRLLEIRTIWSSHDGRPMSYWALRGQELPTNAALPDLEPWLAPLRDQYPSSTPLDDL